MAFRVEDEVVVVQGDDPVVLGHGFPKLGVEQAPHVQLPFHGVFHIADVVPLGVQCGVAGIRTVHVQVTGLRAKARTWEVTTSRGCRISKRGACVKRQVSNMKGSRALPRTYFGGWDARRASVKEVLEHVHALVRWPLRTPSRIDCPLGCERLGVEAVRPSVGEPRLWPRETAPKGPPLRAIWTATT